MIHCNNLTREYTDKILKIIIRELKELGAYNKARHNVIGKETFHWYISFINAAKCLPSSSVAVFWHLFGNFLSKDGISSYLLIKLLDNKEFADVLGHCHDGEFINAQTMAMIEHGINYVISNEFEFLVMSPSVLRKLNEIGHARTKELREIAIKRNLDMRYVSEIDKTGI